MIFIGVILDENQLDAVEKLKSGNILHAGTGVGKSRTAIAYYYLKVCEGKIEVNHEGKFAAFSKPRDLYIITTAKKRDDKEWEKELSNFYLDSGYNKMFGVTVKIDSWNNIVKYRKICGSFFIFDEQRLVGTGVWVKSFYDIARKNKWILLSATPGDKWIDYIPVFVANGFYRNKTDFNARHVIFARFSKYPIIQGYYNKGILEKHRRDITVDIPHDSDIEKHYINVWCDYDVMNYRRVWRDRYDIYEDEPIDETGKLIYTVRKVVNSDESRLRALEAICESNPKIIIFYNFTYELVMLRECLRRLEFDIGEWNGQVHTQIPDSDRWAYLVQYSAGCEGWNCTVTNVMIFFSQNYSYRMTVQAEGRIERRNTPFKELFYYRFKSRSPIDLAITKALKDKKNFNERNFMRRTNNEQH